MNVKKKQLTIISAVLIILATSLISKASFNFIEEPHSQLQLNHDTLEVPHERTIGWKKTSSFADSVYKLWAGKPIDENKLNGKNDVPRILLAKLLLKKEIPLANQTMMKLRAWGITGSSWALNKKGDYDFNLTILTTILWFYGDDSALLYPDTKEYLLNKLLIEEGGKFRNKAPHTLGLAPETENHVLMTEGSRYLKNRWLMLHGNNNAKYNNIENGLEDKLLAFIDNIKKNGLYEFNSLPYTGYTITALLNLEAFASEKVRAEARNVLDYMNWCYALGSYKLKHYPPMRRRYDKEGFKEITKDYHSVFMKGWLSYLPYNVGYKNNDLKSSHALIASCMPYRPADKVVKTQFEKGDGYFVKLGHGAKSCPEIYSAGKNFLLSAGGANRGKRSLIVARPICLFSNVAAENLSEIIHLAGPSSNYMKWNNTGVYKNFACAAGPVIIPASFKTIAQKDNWSVFLLKDSISVVVYSTDKLGIIAVFEGSSEVGLLDEIVKANPDKNKLADYFQFPGGIKISYDVNSPKNKWVITSENDSLLNRDFDSWPLIEGQLKN